MTASEQAMKIFETTIRELYNTLRNASDEPIPKELPIYINGYIHPNNRLPEDHDSSEPIINAHYEGEFDAHCQNDHLAGIAIAINSPTQMIVYSFTEQFFMKEIFFRIPEDSCRYSQYYLLGYNNPVGALTDIWFNPSDYAENYAHWSVNNYPYWEKMVEFIPKQPSLYRNFFQKAGKDGILDEFDSRMKPLFSKEECLAQIAKMPQNIAEIKTIGQVKIVPQINLVSLAKYLCDNELNLNS